MDLVNELSSELALAFLVEKKHSEKLNSGEVLALIEKIKSALQPLSEENDSVEKLFNVENNTRFATH